MDLTPGSPQEVAEVVAEYRARGQPLHPVGGATMLSGAYGVALDTRRLDGIPRHEPADLTVTCGSGLTLSALQARLAEHGQFLPVWHPRPDRATIGGLVAASWSGPGRQLYGRLRDRVLEVRVVTGEGRLVRGGGKVVKNVTGFDLPRLFCGSRGSLGVIVEVTLKVHPSSDPPLGRRIDGIAPAGLAGARRHRSPVELFWVSSEGRSWGYAFAPGPPEDADRVLEGVPPGDPVEGVDVLVDGVLVGEGAGTGVKASVPPALAVELAGRLGAAPRALVDVATGLGWAVFPEAGAAADLRGWAEAAGGTVSLTSAADEVRARLGTWGTPPPGVEIMRRLKAAFDPAAVLPPGPFAS